MFTATPFEAAETLQECFSQFTEEIVRRSESKLQPELIPPNTVDGVVVQRAVWSTDKELYDGEHNTYHIELRLEMPLSASDPGTIWIVAGCDTLVGPFARRQLRCGLRDWDPLTLDRILTRLAKFGLDALAYRPVPYEPKIVLSVDTELY